MSGSGGGRRGTAGRVDSRPQKARTAKRPAADGRLGAGAGGDGGGHTREDAGAGACPAGIQKNSDGEAYVEVCREGCGRGADRPRARTARGADMTHARSPTSAA